MMKIRRNRLPCPICLAVIFILWQGVSLNVLADEGCKLLTADRLFDGFELHSNAAVLIKGEEVKQVGAQEELKGLCKKKFKMGDATIMPGFIESHAHITFQKVRKDKVLEHGITTAQDTGGPLMASKGGQGTLRLLNVGPIIQAEGGYPLNIFTSDGVGGYDKIGYPISSTSSEAEVQDVVQHLVNGGATAIKISLEPGGETGAPWMMPHDGPVPPAPWPVLSLEQVQWIVAKAHALDRRVIAHVGENTGFELALAAGVDEFAHIPCSAINDGSNGNEDLLQRAVDQGVTFVTTIDTLSSCVDTTSNKGIHSNTMILASKGAKFIYGSEIAHDNVPWGINGEELQLMLHLTSGDSIDFTDVINVFKAATSQAGEHLGIPGLGTLTPGAPADIIAVRGNPFERYKLLEYPDLVISGGRTIVNNFK